MAEIDPPDETLLDLTEIARLTSISPRRAWERAHRGDYGPLVRKGRRILISRVEFEQAVLRGLAPLEHYVASQRRLVRESQATRTLAGVR